MSARDKTEQPERPAVACPSCGHKHTPLLDALDRIEREQLRLDEKQQQLEARQTAIESALRGGGN